MKRGVFYGILYVAVWGVVGVICDGEKRVLNVEETKLPDLRPSRNSDPRSSNNILTSAARSVNLSFFIPAFSLFALASQLMPQMFPSFTTATTSSRGFGGGRVRTRPVRGRRNQGRS